MPSFELLSFELNCGTKKMSRVLPEALSSIPEWSCWTRPSRSEDRTWGEEGQRFRENARIRELRRIRTPGWFLRSRFGLSGGSRWAAVVVVAAAAVVRDDTAAAASQSSRSSLFRTDFAPRRTPLRRRCPRRRSDRLSTTCRRQSYGILIVLKDLDKARCHPSLQP